MRRLYLVLALCGCRQILGIDEAHLVDARTDDGGIDAPLDALRPDGAPGAARKRRITVDNTKVFGNLTKFPMWFVYDDPIELAARSTPSGEDIYFTNIDGTPLEFELARWDRMTGHLEAWVRVDLADTASTELDLRYGDPGPAHGPNPPAVFSNGFLAVWHLDDPLTAATVAEARGVTPGTAVNGPTSAAGQLGRAIAFDGTNDEITFTNPIAGSVSTTISAWVSVTAPVSGFSSVMTVGNPANDQSRFLWTNAPSLATGFYGNDSNTNHDITNVGFTLLHWVYDSSVKKSVLYRDGNTIDSAGVPGPINTVGSGGHIGNAPVQWGPGGNTTNPLNGMIDEVRIANVVRTTAWIRTEFANQSSPSTFYAVGPDQPVP